MTGIDIMVRIGLAVLRIRKVTVTEEAAEIDETDSESGGYGECDENGFVQAKVAMEGYIRRADLGPLVVNQLLTNVLIAWDGEIAIPTVNKRDYFPKLKVLTFEKVGGVKEGSITYNFTAKSSGIYYPMGVS